MDREDFKAILIASAISLPLLLVGWWTWNFAVYVYDGTTLPMWTSFNLFVYGMFA